MPNQPDTAAIDRPTQPLFARAALAILLLAVLLGIGTWVFAGPEASLPYILRNKDFTNYWMAGQQTLGGEIALLFGDPGAYYAALKAIFGADFPWHAWSYPPHSLFVTAPLGLMPYLPAMAAFEGVTLALFLLAIGRLGRRPDLIGALLLLPFIVANLAAAQNGFLTGALVVAGLALRADRPLLAGILFGILTIKPQLGILLPVLLLYERNWRAIGAAIATTMLMVAASVLIFGLDAWRGYIDTILPNQAAVMFGLEGDFVHMLASAFGSMRSLGFDGHTAMLAHLPVAALALALYGYALWRAPSPDLRALATVVATFLVTPYATAYDLGPLAAFAALRLDRSRFAPAASLGAAGILWLAVALLPIVMLPLGKAGLPVTPLLLFAALALVATRPAARA